MNNNSLAVINSEDFELIQRVAKVFVASGFFRDSGDLAQAVVKIMAGREMGLPPFASMQQIHIIQGKPILGANAIGTLIKNDPRYDYRVEILSNEDCEIVFFENGVMVGVSQFTMDDAIEAGLAGGQNWKRYPRNMLFARAISNGAKWHTPGIFGGMPVYTPDEFGLEVDEEGDVIEAELAVPVVREVPSVEEMDQGRTFANIDEALADAADVSPEELAEELGAEIVESEGPLTDDELVIYEASALDFWLKAVALIDRYDNIYAAQNAAKKLGITALPARQSKNQPDPAMMRVEIYRKIRDHARARDEEERLEEVGEQIMDAALRD